MRQVVQNIRTGLTTVKELPLPFAPPGGLLVATAASLLSAGTERSVVQLARKNLLAKAQERPDHARRVLQKLRQEGLRAVVSQVRAKLDEPMALGYSSAGIVLECGRGVQEYKPGDRVATAGPHAEAVAIGRNLCAPLPAGVSFEQGCYAAVGAVALQGVRLARVSLGERVLVIGLGLVGQIVVALLKAQGCRVFGTDLNPSKLDLARSLGADEVALGSPREAVLAFAGAQGVDAVIIAAATRSNEPIEFAAEVTRTRGRIVLVGVAGLTVPRPPFFAKELEFTVSSSLGPGRGDPAYEEKGVDLPPGYVRWTAQRNMAAVLELIAAGKLPVERLTTHRFDIGDAPRAYDLITGPEPESQLLGVLLQYPESLDARRRVELKAPATVTERIGLGVIGAGNFARLVLLPILGRHKGLEPRGLCTAKGLNAVASGERHGFSYATTDVGEVLGDSRTSAVIVATRHHLHAELVISALRAGKNVFVEKPLCISLEELQAIDGCIRELGARCPVLMVGFNRRFSPGVDHIRRHFSGVGPLSISFRFATGSLPAAAWPQDEDVGGGRIVGEACHAIDTCTAIAGSPPVRVFAESTGKDDRSETTDDRVFITLRHENGSISSISYQAGSDRGGPAERIEVFGAGRSAVGDEWDGIDLWAGGKRSRARGGRDKGHTAEIASFFEACRRGGEWPVSWRDLHAVSLASLLAVRSLREGMPLALQDFLPPPDSLFETH